MKDIETIADNRERAVALHRSGDIAGAIASYQAILEADPTDTEMQGLLGMAQYQSGQEDTALATWRKSLAMAAPAPVKLRIIANCLRATQKATTQASSLADIAIPDWPQDIRPDQQDRRMLLALARMLVKRARPDEAVRLLDSALPHLLDDADFVVPATETMLEAGLSEKVVQILEPLTPRSDLADVRLLITQAAALCKAGRDDDAQNLTRRATEALPVYLTPKEPNQMLLVGVLNRAPVMISEPVSPMALHFASNTPATLAAKLNDQYRFLSIFPEAASAAHAFAGQPRPHVILNNWVNSELLSEPETLASIADFADRLKLPVLNHPRHAVETTRQRNAERLAGIPGLVIPRTLRIINAPAKRDLLLRVIEKELGFPVIIRDPFAQAGYATARIDTPADLGRHLAQISDPQLYATQYIANPVAGNLFRKIRAAVIGPDIFITHVHFAARWNVHRERGKDVLAAFDGDGRHKSLADRMIAEPEKALGPSALAALSEIRNRIPLDFFGIDFDMMPDGRILFFEANAAMNLAMTDRPGLEKTRTAMRAALRRLFESPPSHAITA